MDLLTFAMFMLGLVLLIAGGELLVRGASSMAAAAGISPLVIGLTVVAFGTSAPELAVSVRAVLAGQGEIAAGNVIGSNICNVLLILGLSAVVCPLPVSAQLVRLDVPIMICAAALMVGTAVDGIVSRVEGAGLVMGLGAYTAFLVRAGRRESQKFQVEAATQGEEKLVVKAVEVMASSAADSPAEAVRQRPAWALQLALLAGGLVSLVVGARWLVNGAVAFATSLGVSELVIGLTVVAIGTSLPEIATSIIASLRGQRDLAVGNIVGSNIFNVLGILGTTALVAPVPVPVAARSFDPPVMLAVSVACLPVFYVGRRIARWEGAMFLGYYVAYTSYLLMAASNHAALPLFRRALIFFVLPITVVTIGVLAVQAIRTERRASLASRPEH